LQSIPFASLAFLGPLLALLTFVSKNVKYMTYKELYAIVGDKPFIWAHSDTNLEFHGVLYVDEVNDTVHDSLISMDMGYEIITAVFNLNETFHAVLIDYFDDKKICDCDFVNVILVTGCKCGGQ